jgi:hypothetical protein
MCVSGEMYLYRKRLFNALRFFALRLLCSALCEGSSRYSGETAASQSQALTRFGMSFGEMHSELICTMWIAKAIDDDSMTMIMREARKIFSAGMNYATFESPSREEEEKGSRHRQKAFVQSFFSTPSSH